MREFVVTVKKEFLDRYAGKRRKVGEKFPVTEQRFREIKRSGDYVEPVQEKAKESAEKK